MAAPALTVAARPGRRGGRSASRGWLLRAASAIALAVLSAVATGCSSEPTRPATVDAVDGFSIVLPPGWIHLESGDPAWAVVYGQRGSQPEQDVDDGTIRFFAVPVPPDPHDAELNLAVYVEGVAAQTSLSDLADAYEATWAGTARITKTDRTEVDLPAGHAIRLTGLRTVTGGDPTRVSWLRAYILVRDSRAYYLLPVCADDDVARYEPVFDELLGSLRFL